MLGAQNRGTQGQTMLKSSFKDFEHYLAIM